MSVSRFLVENILAMGSSSAGQALFVDQVERPSRMFRYTKLRSKVTDASDSRLRRTCIGGRPLGFLIRKRRDRRRFGLAGGQEQDIVLYASKDTGEVAYEDDT